MKHIPRTRTIESESVWRRVYRNHTQIAQHRSDDYTRKTRSYFGDIDDLRDNWTTCSSQCVRATSCREDQIWDEVAQAWHTATISSTTFPWKDSSSYWSICWLTTYERSIDKSSHCLSDTFAEFFSGQRVELDIMSINSASDGSYSYVGQWDDRQEWNCLWDYHGKIPQR